MLPGVPAVLVSLQRAYAQMGAARTVSTLARLNQRHGFDCPGCAWPETPGHRKPAEFCENGAKAVAEEATLRTVTPPEFFARHSVDDLAARTDYWLGQQGRITHRWCCDRAATTTSRSPGTRPSHSSPTNCARSRHPTTPSSTPRAARATRPRSSTSCSSAATAPTTCRTVRTCATNRPVAPSSTRSASARARCRFPTSNRPV